MTIPLATTTIAVRRPSESGSRDPFETAPTYTTVASGVRAVVGAPTFTEQFIGGQQQVMLAHLTCDPVDLQATDRVLDESTELEWGVIGILPRAGFSLDHTAATLRIVAGEATG